MRWQEEIEWRELRADQLREKARQDAIVILPVASLEQHGPHLPVEVELDAGGSGRHPHRRITAAKSQPVLVLPVLWTGLSEHHMSFGGTITLDNSAFAAVVEGVVRSVLRHGFKRIVLLNAHGGNENALRAITDDLTPRYRAAIIQFTYWYAAAVPIARILETQGGLSHACEAETSMMMALRPDLVATDRIPLAKSNTTPNVDDRWGAAFIAGAVSAAGQHQAWWATRKRRAWRRASACSRPSPRRWPRNSAIPISGAFPGTRSPAHDTP